MRERRTPGVLRSYADAIERQYGTVIDSDFLPVLRRAADIIEARRSPGAPAGDTERALRELREKVDNRLGVMLAEKSGLPESTHSHLCEMSRAVLAEFDASLRSAAPEGTETTT